MANALTLKADEKNNLKFEVAIQGATEPVTEIRFTLKNDELFRSYPCSLKNNIVEVEVSDLDKDDNDYNEFLLEIFIGNKYFSPVEGSLEIIKPVVVESKVKEVKDNEVNIKAESTAVQSEAISVSTIINEVEPKKKAEKIEEKEEVIQEVKITTKEKPQEDEFLKKIGSLFDK